MEEQFLLPAWFDYGATFLWAITGALVAARRGYDIVGVIALAMVSGTGGGLLRDGIFLQQPPVLVQSPIYIWIVLIAGLYVLLVRRFVRGMRFFRTFVALVDAAGLGAYAVVGMQKAIVAGLSPTGVVLVGIVNAIGGGVLRDILMGEEPEIFKPGKLAALAVLIGCAIYMLLVLSFAFDATIAAWVTIGVVFVVRVISVRFNLRTQAARLNES